MAGPEDAHLMADAVVGVEGEVVKEEEQHPRPNLVGRHPQRADRVERRVEDDYYQRPTGADNHAAKAHRQARRRVTAFIADDPILSLGDLERNRLQGQEDDEERDGE